MRHLALVVLAVVAVACSPVRELDGSERGVRISPNGGDQADVLSAARRHCAEHARKARFVSQDRKTGVYVFACTDKLLTD